MSNEVMGNLLREFGNSIDLPDLELDGDNRCNLLFDETIPVSFELSEDEAAIYIYSSIGAVPADKRGAIGTVLLNANYGFRDTAGATLGLDQGNGEVMLLRGEKLEGMQLADLDKILTDFVNLAEQWRNKLDELISGAAPDAPASQTGDDLAPSPRAQQFRA